MHHPRFALAALILAAVGLATGSVWARGELPQVRFDVAYTVGCRDVTPEEFAQQNPDERLVEARFQVSTFFVGRDADGLVEFLYVVDSPRKTLSVVDYQPKTTLESEYAGHIGHEKKQEKSATLGLGLSGTAQHIVNADASASALNKSTNTVRYDLLPPLELLAASGTIQRGAGVYFKLKPSPRTTLEGAKEFVLTLRVPSAWRADYLHLTCRATASRRGAAGEGPVCGEAGFVLALYAEGQPQAREAAEWFVRRQLDLRRSVAEHQRDIRRRAYPSLAHKLGGLLEVVPPEIPDGWYRDVLYGGGAATEPEYVDRLPADVAQAVRNYVAAKQSLHLLARGPDDQAS